MIGSNISMCIDFYHQPHLDFHRRTPIIPLNIKTSETAMTNLAENIKITPTGGPWVRK